jgi:NAD+ diphosphatase
LEGDDEICLDEEELAAGVWLPREEIPEPDKHLSLTGEMIEVFRCGFPGQVKARK